MSALFAATYPDRVSHLLLYGGFVRRTLPADFVENRIRNWGKGEVIRVLSPSIADNPEMVRLFGKFERLSASPGSIRGFMQLIGAIDVGPILPTIRTPTLVLRRHDSDRSRSRICRTHSRREIHRISDRRSCGLGRRHRRFDRRYRGIRDRATRNRRRGYRAHSRDRPVHRYIVDSTRKAADAGDRQWRRWLDEHDRIARQMVEKHRGHWIKSTGDGWRPSTVQGARCVARLRSARRCARPGYRCVQACIPARSNCAAMTSAASQSTRPRA